MKNLFNLCVMVLLTVQVSAQPDQEITTTMITIQDLITHAADNYPSEEKQKLFLLVEVDEKGMDTDARFYLEQGLSLLVKRLKPEDNIAIGTYGDTNGILLPYTQVKNGDQITAVIQSLAVAINNNTTTDGIDQAFQMAKAKYEPDASNTVIMMRNDRIASAVTENAKSNLRDTSKNKTKVREVSNNSKLGGAIALTALSLLPEILDVIKN